MDAKTERAAAAKEEKAKPDAARAADPNARLFPDAHLQVDRVRAMDADVHFRARSIQAGAVPFKQVAFRIKLDNGVMSLDPFAFEMPKGRLLGDVRIDAHQVVP